MVRKLTVRQEQVLHFVIGHLDNHGYPPTLKEIAVNFGMSSINAVRDHLRALEGKGYLRRDSDKSRAIILTSKGRRRGFPLLGDVAAGSPIMAEQNYQDFIDLGEYFGKDPDTFVLRVKGDSMIEVGICQGDLVVVHHQPTLESGDIGVVCLGQEATVKRVFIEGARIRLQPENDTMSPTFIFRDDPDLRIAGKVIGVIRKL